ncbi:MAG: cell division protein FtsZ [Bacteroidales bacterium]|jgi:cell division protein FtsZ|nr:cell division protein FtsZ [Bacteroidales bacterium]
MPEMLKFEHPKDQSNIIKVIGVGGGGSNAVTHMFEQGIKGVDFILCNTDSQALDTSPVPTKVHLGKRELGAGNDPAVGRDAALATVEEFRELLEKHTKMLFITAGLGGGTGTGAAPVVAQVAHELDILTVGIVTLPFGFEGRKRRQQALEGLEELRKHVDTLLIISNDKLREEYGNMKLTEAFKRADDVLTIAAKGIAEIITVTGYINVDFEDVNTVMRQSGKAIMGSSKAEGENRALKAIEDAMRSPLLNDSNIAGAQNILLYITSGEDEVSLDEVLEITDYIQQTCGNTAEVIWGNGKDDSLGNNIAITIIATGFDNDDDIPVGKSHGRISVTDLYGNQTNTRHSLSKEIAAKPVSEGNVIRHQLHDDKPEEIAEKTEKQIEKKNEVPQQRTIFSFVDKEERLEKKPKVHRLEEDKSEPELKKTDERNSDIPFPVVINKTEKKEEQSFYASSKTSEPVSISIGDSDPKEELKTAVEKPAKEAGTPKEELDRNSMLRQSRLKAMSMKLHSSQGLDELERQPAYMRRGLKLDDPEQTNPDKAVSRYSLKDEKSGLSSSNSFLHDNVD